MNEVFSVPLFLVARKVILPLYMGRTSTRAAAGACCWMGEGGAHCRGFT